MFKLIEIACLGVAAVFAFTGLWLQACFMITAATYIGLMLSKTTNFFLFHADDKLKNLLSNKEDQQKEKE